MDWITEDHIADAEQYGCVFAIGQLTKEDIIILKKRIRTGRCVRVKAMWPWYHWGTREKTCYVNLEPIPASARTPRGF